MPTTQYIADDVDQLIKQAQREDGDPESIEVPTRAEVIRRALEAYVDD
jgi:hypothetical protein